MVSRFPLLLYSLSFCTLSILCVSNLEETFNRGIHPCYSCASFAYLPEWHRLMHHYFPPKNFSDRCWQPDPDIGIVPCQTACFTIVEKVITSEENYLTTKAVMRGCVDRLLLFGIDEDVKNQLSSIEHRQTQCRVTDRKILRLFPLSEEKDPILLCSCVGDYCNEQDMLLSMSSNKILSPLFFYLLIILFYIL